MSALFDLAVRLGAATEACVGVSPKLPPGGGELNRQTSKKQPLHRHLAVTALSQVMGSDAPSLTLLSKAESPGDPGSVGR